jgi:hypothetical protein
MISKDILSPRSPELSSNYYMQGAIKGADYRDNPYTLLEVKEAIADFIRNIPPTELSRVFANKIGRVDACLRARGGRFQHLF